MIHAMDMLKYFFYKLGVIQVCSIGIYALINNQIKTLVIIWLDFVNSNPSIFTVNLNAGCTKLLIGSEY
jgi:hypothetical protein